MDYQLTQTGPEVQGILNQAPEVVAVGDLNTIDAVGNYYVTDGNGNARGYLICSQSGPAGSPFYLQTYLHDGAIYSRSGNALPLTGEWVNPMQDVASIKKVSTEELNGLINSSDNGLYYANLGGTTPALVQVYRDGAKAYQWLIEPHTGKIYVRDYNTQAATPAWSDLVDAYADKQDTISDLSTIRSGAAAGATAYQKPSTGIPKTDLASAVQESLGKADAAAPQANTYTKNEIDEIIESIGSPITEIQRSALDDTTTPGMYKVVGTTGSSAANSSWISLLLVSDYDFSMIGGSTNHIVTQRLFNGRGASDSVKIEERTKANNGLWSEWVDIYGSDIDEIWEELDAKQNTIDDLSTIRSGAAAGATAVQPATMNTALAAKQDTINTVNVTVDNNTGTPSGSASVSGGTLSLSFQNLKGATGEQGPQGIQGVQGVQGPKGDTGVTGDASSLAIIHGIDKTSSYGTTDVCGADAAQALLNAIEGGFYY